jgi:hypothetical protein
MVDIESDLFVDLILDATSPPIIGSMCRICKSNITWLVGRVKLDLYVDSILRGGLTM